MVVMNAEVFGARACCYVAGLAENRQKQCDA